MSFRDFNFPLIKLKLPISQLNVSRLPHLSDFLIIKLKLPISHLRNPISPSLPPPSQARNPISPSLPPPSQVRNPISPSYSSDLEIEEQYLLNEGYSLRSHQKEAINWMRSREAKNVGGILALSMGAGKTLIGLYQIASNLNKKEISLIICGKTLVSEWVNGINQFFGQKKQIRYLVLHPDYVPNSNIKKIQYKKFLDQLTYSYILNNYDVIITTYEQATISMKENNSDNWIIEKIYNKIENYRKINVSQHGDSRKIGIALLHNIHWARVIADEVQQIVNFKTKAFLACASLLCNKRFGFSGTPTKNKDADFWSLLFFAGYDEINNPKYWKYENYLDLTDRWLFNIEFNSNIPPLIEKFITINMDEATLFIYRFYFNQLEDLVSQFRVDNKSVEFSNILTLFLRLRQICITPFLLSDNSKSKIKDKDKNLISNLDTCYANECIYYSRLIHDRNAMGYSSAKNNIVINMLNSIVTSNDSKGIPNNVLVFSFFSSELELLKGYYDYNNITTGYIKGSDTGDKRTIILDNFRQGKTRILFLQYKTGAQGLNLTAANYVFTIEPWWNSTFEDQAVSRAHRSGQTREVTWYRFITRLTIEEQILEMARKKKTITKSYINKEIGESKREKATSISLDQLEELIRGNKKSLFS